MTATARLGAVGQWPADPARSTRAADKMAISPQQRDSEGKGRGLLWSGVLW